MPAVLGSKQKKMVVVEYRPLRDFIFSISLFICLLLVGGGSYWYGHSKAISDNGNALEERDMLLVALENSESEVGFLRQSIVNTEQSTAVDRHTLVDVQETILSLREKNAQLEDDVLFYKQIMSPDNNESGLSIGLVDFFATEDDNRIRYRIEFKQLSNNENTLSGHVNVNLIGLQDGVEVSLALRELSAVEANLDIRLKFKFFQNLEGELLLPEGFVPGSVHVMAVSEGDKGKTVQKNFAWLIQT